MMLRCSWDVSANTCFMVTNTRLHNDDSIFRHQLNTPWLSVTAMWASTIFVATGSVAVSGQIIIITLLLFLSFCFSYGCCFYVKAIYTLTDTISDGETWTTIILTKTPPLAHMSDGRKTIFDTQTMFTKLSVSVYSGENKPKVVIISHPQGPKVHKKD